MSLADETYEVVIDSTLENGSLSYAECFLPGSSEREFLVYTHVCHPSLCNDNLSGIAVVVALVRHLMSAPRHYSYRFVFGPGTIGSITWLSRNEPVVERVDGGLVLSLLGDAGPLTYKASRRGDSVIDEVVDYVLGQRAPSARRIDFEPYGYDERQFCSPGFNLPMGRLTRTPNGQYPQYHTSADDLGFVSAQALGESLDVCRSIVETFDANRYYRNRLPKCEPQLGRRGLYAPMGGGQSTPHRQMAMLWLLNLCDGEHSLLDVARRSGIDFAHLLPVRDELIAAELLDEVPAPGGARS